MVRVLDLIMAQLNPIKECLGISIWVPRQSTLKINQFNINLIKSWTSFNYRRFKIRNIKLLIMRRCSIKCLRGRWIFLRITPLSLWLRKWDLFKLTPSLPYPVPILQMCTSSRLWRGLPWKEPRGLNISCKLWLILRNYSGKLEISLLKPLEESQTKTTQWSLFLKKNS